MAKAGAAQSMGDSLMEAAQAVTRAMGAPEANGQMLPMLQKIQTVLVGMVKGPGPQPPGGGAAPGAAPAGTPAGAGMGPPGGGAANPAMPALTGGGGAPPGAGATTAIPQVPPDELRRAIAQGIG